MDREGYIVIIVILAILCLIYSGMACYYMGQIDVLKSQGVVHEKK